MSPSFSKPARLAAACALLLASASSAGCNLLDEVLPEEPPPPAPISGGTLAVTADDALAIAADTEGDRVFIVDLATNTIRHDVSLQPGDEPGRVVEGPAGTAYVALRSGGAVAAVDLTTGTVTRRDACPAPRGLAYDAARDQLHVACAGGELVTLPSDPTAPPVRTLRLARDLRDVVVHNDQLLVSRFRAAEVLIVSAEGGVSHRLAPTSYTSPTQRFFEPAVAWRMVAVPGGAAMVHQRAFAGELPTGPAPGTTYYGGPCDTAVVHSAVTVFDADASVRVTLDGMGAIGNVTLPVDMAVSAEGRVAVVSAGVSFVLETSLEIVTSTDAMQTCTQSENERTFGVANPVAAAYTADGRLLVQGRTRLLTIIDPEGAPSLEVPFPEDRVPHTGHTLFHMAAGGNVACASCHPEAGDDGRVWHFASIGERRTQTMRGGVLDTAPLHWDGDMSGLDSIMTEVFVNRMGGAPQDERSIESLAGWIQSLDHLPVSAPRDGAAAGRGEQLFNDPAVGCATCHAGDKLTNDQTVDVGTGKAFQVPSLVGIGDRAPFMHDGCARALRDRFDPACGGGDAHGKTSQLTDEEIDDLVAFLETL